MYMRKKNATGLSRKLPYNIEAVAVQLLAKLEMSISKPFPINFQPKFPFFFLPLLYKTKANNNKTLSNDNPEKSNNGYEF